MKARLFGTTRIISSRVTIAEGTLERLKGLMGRERLESSESLLIRPCKGIHTFAMRFPIDALFLDGSGSVVHLVEDMGPGRMTRVVLKARAVLELQSGTIVGAGVRLGDTIEFLP